MIITDQEFPINLPAGKLVLIDAGGFVMFECDINQMRVTAPIINMSGDYPHDVKLQLKVDTVLNTKKQFMRINTKG
jgi:hypothetical protein